mmetsp:Transcript_77377/g.185415  ORF Transcript_77377/g.185415 Transcript_77377/m.185415 type:complete len:229 (-) Transcript_77377:926-1612(-)
MLLRRTRVHALAEEAIIIRRQSERRPIVRLHSLLAGRKLDAFSLHDGVRAHGQLNRVEHGVLLVPELRDVATLDFSLLQLVGQVGHLRALASAARNNAIHAPAAIATSRFVDRADLRIRHAGEILADTVRAFRDDLVILQGHDVLLGATAKQRRTVVGDLDVPRRKIFRRLRVRPDRRQPQMARRVVRVHSQLVLDHLHQEPQIIHFAHDAFELLHLPDVPTDFNAAF